MLVDVSGLRAHLGDPQWLILDCRHDLTDHTRGRRLYDESHLPGAHFMPVETALAGEKTGVNGRHPLPAPQAFAECLNQLGATATTRIVAYDDVGGQYAARLWWLARWIGLEHVHVLDGGWSAWTTGGHPLDAAVPPARGGGTVQARADASRIATTEEVLASLTTGRHLVVDARAPERYRGEVEPIDRVAGRIPSAASRFFKANLNADLTLRAPADLRREFASLLGGRPAAEVIHQCGSGVTACVNLLAMEHAGLTGSRLYPGSWSEWIADPARPVARG